MVAHVVDGSGICTTCQQETNGVEVLKCYDCQKFFHGVCNNEAIYCSKTFLGTYQKQRDNFIFVCDVCLTKKEQNQASDLKDQIADLADTVKTLAQEFKLYKEGKKDEPVVTNELHGTAWGNTNRVNKMKSSLCIKANGNPVNMEKVEELVTNNNIQVTKAVVKENGDVYIDMPSQENRERITPLLNDEAFTQNQVVSLKSKLPTITILNVNEFTTKEAFIETVKNQNHKIKEKIDAGSEFTVVFSNKRSNDNKFQVVARVSEEIRKVIKLEGDKIYNGLGTNRVVDRFYIKRCNKCQQFGHYERDCENELCCGYCRKNHKSTECQEVAPGDHDKYECNNCHRNDKPSLGHSSIYHKCPTYIEMQKKLKKTIPYYSKNL